VSEPRRRSEISPAATKEPTAARLAPIPVMPSQGVSAMTDAIPQKAAATRFTLVRGR